MEEATGGQTRELNPDEYIPEVTQEGEDTPPERVTKEVADKHVRETKPFCRGPFQDFAVQEDSWDKLELPQNVFEAIQHLEKSGVGPKTTGEARQQLLALGAHREANAFDTAVRLYCGQSLTDQIIAAPLDGKDHQLTCPRCGTPYTVRRPKVQG
jgi:hypothetical protein